jgi:hypothetical protein
VFRATRSALLRNQRGIREGGGEREIGHRLSSEENGGDTLVVPV